MTETRFTWRWIIVTGGIGIVGGLLLGVIVGWALGPATNSTADVAGLSAAAQNDYLVMVANSFAYDDDLPRARERLALLKETQVNARIERLAKALAARNDPSAAYLADLAVALGSSDSALQVLAASISNNARAGPTKFALPESTATLSPTVPADTPTIVPSETPTSVPTKAAQAQGPTKTPRPIATAAPTQVVVAAPLVPEWHPDYPASWWPGVSFTAATVSAGQQYWHIKWALYCDVDDSRNNCPGLPGGNNDHTIYVAVQNPDGSCANAPSIKHQINTGDMVPLYVKDVLYPWNSCATVDYEWPMIGEGSDIWIDGMPSDRIGGLCMCNQTIASDVGHGILQGHAHVRYFVIFQLTTR